MSDKKKCPSCGACKECGGGGKQLVPYPVYVYPCPTQPVPQWRPYWNTIGGNVSVSSNATSMSH